jgi:predicted mannosyl-3-phosphoglycerate phosphatase (HAD superfamily)
MAKTKTLFTIGYEQTPAKAVLDELQSAGVCS